MQLRALLLREGLALGLVDAGGIRKGGKLLIAGASKAGKSYLLIELAVAVATDG